MQRAIDETNRRRAKQIEFNAQHGIEPRTIRKAVQDVMEGARSSGRGRARGEMPRRPGGETRRGGYERLTPEQAVARIQQLEKRMYQHARDLEFEQAAHLRDEINELREQGLGFPKRVEEPA
jgi:excinuclease ABC subunit B